MLTLLPSSRSDSLRFQRLLITAHAFGIATAATVTGTLGVRPAGHRTAHTILNGDSLHRGGLTQRHRPGVQRARCPRRATIQRVANLSPALSTHRHLRALRKLRLTAVTGADSIVILIYFPYLTLYSS